ncbi:MAG: YwaF family protein [Erysipelotrichaceae bacterium]|nr:YwaF family protein [Erysipelotrichaceae bacterium]MBR2701479.1 YwaF family protein [Erysipelotrichaceae bacterium]
MRVSKKEARIKVFNIWWWFYVILTILFLLLVTLIGRKMSVDSRCRLILILSIAELIILRLYKFSLKDIREDYNYYNELPCYLCNQATILCIIRSIFRIDSMMAYCVSIGSLGAVLAFVMPDSYNRDQLVFSKQAYGFYGYHGLLIVTCLSFLTLGIYQPVIRDCIWAGIYTIVLAVIAHVINVFLVRTGLNEKSNYVFTMYPDNVILQRLYDMFPVRLFYMLPIPVVFTAYALVLFLIMR